MKEEVKFLKCCNSVRVPALATLSLVLKTALTLCSGLYQEIRMVQLDLNVVLLLLDEKLCIRTVFLKSHVNWSERENRRHYLPKQSFVQ